jgi:hypothetical protein
MMDEQTRTLLKQQQWTIVDKDVSLVTQKALFSAWKQYANGAVQQLIQSCYDWDDTWEM